jgi:hypothetical protein
MQTQTNNSLLDVYPVGATRRNHGLEHATLHVLAQRFPRLPFAGHSDPGGFWIVGNISTDDLFSAVDEALQRLRNGESQLAVHPNCGTNLVTAGAMAGLAGALAMFGAGSGRRQKLERLPLAITLATMALMVAQPVGMALQARVTTSGDPGSLHIVEIRAVQRGRIQSHRIVTREII